MDRLQDLVRNVDLQDRRNIYIALTAPILAPLLLGPFVRVLRSIFSHGSLHHPLIYPAPRPSTSSSSASATDLATLAYPPDALPGARDVETPYGRIRAYEWGPTTGRKVLMVHGISTPCIAFAGMAAALVAQHGCRVLLFDLFGRGYSDAPDPAAVPQDLALFTSQILLVLASSELSWTGGGGGENDADARFTLVGYSLGGGIAAAFASYFPRLVGSLVLIAPGGLLRPDHISVASKVVYGGLLPSGLVNWYIGRRLGGGGVGSAAGVGSSKPKSSTESNNNSSSETPSTSHPAMSPNSNAPLFPDRPGMSVARAVAWQIATHPGFLPSFASSIQVAPTQHCHALWRRIGARQTNTNTNSDPPLRERKVLILLGERDGIIVADELQADATAALGEGNVVVRRFAAGHDLPVVRPGECVEAMARFWEEEGEKEDGGRAGAGLL